MIKGERQCGECEVCCVALKVPDIGKEARSPCHLLNRKGPGCSLHGSKLQPRICDVWQCLWRKGEVSIDARPDRVGIVSYIGADQSLCIQEVKDRAFKVYPHFKEEVLKMSDRTGINAEILHHNGDKTLVVPKKNAGMYKELDHIIKECEKANNES